MSAKQQLAEAISSLPESSSLEEAFERLYQAFKEKLKRQARSRGAGPSRPASQPEEKREAFPVIDVGAWPEGLSLRREDLYGDDER